MHASLLPIVKNELEAINNLKLSEDFMLALLQTCLIAIIRIYRHSLLFIIKSNKDQ